MFKVERKDYGVRLTFGGFIKEDEMKKWRKESENVCGNLSGSFGVFVDMRELKPLPAESQVIMQEGQKMFKQKGMTRSVVILADQVTTMQFKRIAKETGINQWERYIDASKEQKWEMKGLHWIKDGIDSDL